MNQDRLLEGKIKELQNAIDLMSKSLINNELIEDIGLEVINIIKEYSKSWDLLLRYDENNLNTPEKINNSTQEIIDYQTAKKAIEEFKNQIKPKGLFAIERDNALKGILGNLMQSFCRKRFILFR